MAKGQITGKELIADDVITRLADMDGRLLKILATYNELIKSAQNFKTPVQGNDIIKQRNDLDANAIKLLKQKADLQGKLITNEKKELALQTAKNKSGGSTNLAQYKSLNNAYEQQSRLLNSLRSRYKALGISQLQGNKLTKEQAIEYRSLGKEVIRLDAQLKKVDASAGQFQRNVGNYPKFVGAATRSIKAFLGAFGLTSGIFLFATAMKRTVGIFKEFDQGQADLAAVLGRNKNEIGALTKQAKQLGATTAFTANQVSELQLELAKLGFDDGQILAAAEGVENLAIATGVDAARAAKLAGAALRGFNLDASESNRVAAALAVSTTKSASSFETLEVSLPKVSAIAKSFGFTIEDTTALLGGLQNAGFEASIAGTSLRQIFLQLADSNGKLAKRLGGGAKDFDQLIEQFKKVEKEGISLSEAFNLTNARSVAAFKVFLSGADDLKTLRDSITNVEGELKQLAETKLDSLTGDLTLLTSAFEGLVLSIEDGDGAISSFFRSATQGLTDFLTGLRDLNIGATEKGVLAARGVIDDFKNSTEIIAGETKEFIVSTIQEADENIIQLQARVSELKDSGKIGELFTPFYFKKLEEAQALLDKEKSSRDELYNILIEEGKYKDDLADKTARLAVLVGAEKGNEIDLTKQVLYFQGLTVEQLKNLNKEYSDYLKSIEKTADEEKKKAKSQKYYAEGTIGRLEQLISKEKEVQKSTSLTNDQFVESASKIKVYEEQIDRITGAFRKLEKVQLNIKATGDTESIQKEFDKISKIFKDEGLFDFSLFDGTGFDFLTESTKKSLTELERYNEARKNGEKAYTEFLQSEKEKQRDLSSRIMGELFGTFAGYYQLDLSAFHDLLEGKKGLEIDYAATINSIANSILNGKLEKYDVEAQKNQDILDAILNDKNSSEKKKLQAQKEFDKKDAELRNKKAKAERDAILFQISIDTAQSVAKALLNAYALLSNPVTAPLAANAFTQAAIAGAFGALQLGFVASKKLPEFFLGKNASNNFEGLATWGERRKEVKIDEYGGVEVSPNKTTPLHVKSSDIIAPSMGQFDREIKNPNSEIFKRVSKRYKQDTAQRTSLSVVRNSGDSRSMEKTIERVMSKYMSKPFNINNNVTLTQPRKKYHRG